MQHHTHSTGDIAVTAVIFDLTKKGWIVFRPVTAEFLPYDLVASKKNKDGTQVFRTFQVKACDYAKHNRYAPGEFDYFALYIKSKDVVVYPSLEFAKANTTTTLQISSCVPNSSTKVWWYEDFLHPHKGDRAQRNFKDFGGTIKQRVTEKMVRALEKRKKNRKIKLSDTQLKRLVWRKPLTAVGEELGVSGNSVKSECVKRGIQLPDRGYWLRRGIE